MLKGIIFDLDGTLVDSLSTTFDAFNHAFVRHGVRKHTPAEIVKYFGAGENKIFSQMLGPEKGPLAYHTCRAYMDANRHLVPLHNGIGDLLDLLKEKNIPISICTGRTWSTTEIILDHLGLMERFVTVIAYDHVSKPKPAPEGLILAMKKMDLSPEDTMFVGDSNFDIVAGRAAGVHSVGALWDTLTSREALEPYNPHSWAQTPSDVWDIFSKLRL